MGLILPILLLGLTASLSPSTIIVFTLVLETTRARVNAAAFLIGWALSLTVVFTASYALGASRTSQRGGGRTGVEIFEILLGLTLVGVAAREWQHRDAPSKSSGGGGSERFTGPLRGLKPWGAAVVGVLKQPWAITAAAAVVVVQHHPTPVVTVIAFVCFTVVSTATVAVIFLYYAYRPDEADARLSALRDRVVAAGPALFAIVALLVGGFLTIDGLIRVTGT